MATPALCAYEAQPNLQEVILLDRAYDISSLPHHPDLAAINQLCIDLVEMQGW